MKSYDVQSKKHILNNHSYIGSSSSGKSLPAVPAFSETTAAKHENASITLEEERTLPSKPFQLQNKWISSPNHPERQELKPFNFEALQRNTSPNVKNDKTVLQRVKIENIEKLTADDKKNNTTAESSRDLGLNDGESAKELSISDVTNEHQVNEYQGSESEKYFFNSQSVKDYGTFSNRQENYATPQNVPTETSSLLGKEDLKDFATEPLINDSTDELYIENKINESQGSESGGDFFAQDQASSPYSLNSFFNNQSINNDDSSSSGQESHTIPQNVPAETSSLLGKEDLKDFATEPLINDSTDELYIENKINESQGSESGEDLFAQDQASSPYSLNSIFDNQSINNDDSSSSGQESHTIPQNIPTETSSLLGEGIKNDSAKKMFVELMTNDSPGLSGGPSMLLNLAFSILAALPGSNQNNSITTPGKILKSFGTGFALISDLYALKNVINVLISKNEKTPEEKKLAAGQLVIILADMSNNALQISNYMMGGKNNLLTYSGAALGLGVQGGVALNAVLEGYPAWLNENPGGSKRKYLGEKLSLSKSRVATGLGSAGLLSGMVANSASFFKTAPSKVSSLANLASFSAETASTMFQYAPRGWQILKNRNLKSESLVTDSSPV